MPLRKWLVAPIRKVAAWALRGVALSEEAAAKLFGFYRPTLSGVTVTDRSALESPEYFAGVRNVAEDLATLPLIVYKRLGERRRERDVEHPLYEILHDSPNEEMDRTQFVEMMQAWLMIRRNCYAEVQRTNGGQVVGLWPIPPSRVSLYRVDGQLVYRVSLSDGQVDQATGQPYTLLDRSRMFHLKAFALDGVLGESSVEMHREAIGVSLALDRYGAAYFGNDSTPGGVYESAKTLGDKAYERMKKELEEERKGLSNSHRIRLLEDGLTFKTTAVPNDQGQFVQSKRYSAEQMARLNRNPPHKIGDLTKSSFSNIEHQGIDYVVSSIRPSAVRWELAIRTQLFTREERRTHYAEFLLDALLRGDAGSRAAALHILRQDGIINADEWRELENMNEIPGGAGSAYLINGNMTPIDQASGMSTVLPLDKQVEAAGALIRAGFEPQDVLAMLGLPAMAHSGLPPVTLKAPEPAPLEADEAARVFRPLFLAAAERCLQRESSNLGKAVERVLRAKGAKKFEEWGNEFYREMDATIRQAFAPIAEAVGEALRGPEGPDLGDWAAAHAGTIAARRLEGAKSEMVGALMSSDAAGRLLAMAGGIAKRGFAEAWADAELAAMVESLGRYLASEQAA